MRYTQAEIKSLLFEALQFYHQKDFIKDDPIQIPHAYQERQDIEISAFFAAVFAWGKRSMIIDKSKTFLGLMGQSPYDFVVNHRPEDLKPFENFKHRTFKPEDAMYMLRFLQQFYQKEDSLETAFSQHLSPKAPTVEEALIGFHSDFFSLPDAPLRTQKHLPTPAKNAACKRINMFLRWMVRKDDKKIDFGIWHKIKMSQLVCPIDVHVFRVATLLGITDKKTLNWNTALEINDYLKKLVPEDPVLLDYALFGLGVMPEKIPTQ